MILCVFQEARKPPNLFFAYVQTRTRVYACGVSMKCVVVYVQVVLDKKKYYTSTSCMYFRNSNLVTIGIMNSQYSCADYLFNILTIYVSMHYYLFNILTILKQRIL